MSIIPSSPDPKYIITNYTVTTSDNYILALFKVNLSPKFLSSLPAKYKSNKNKPVLIQHGLFSDAGSMLIRGEDKSFAYYMINKGYDVWFGNNRGSIYSTTTKDEKTEEEFYKFSFEEMGLYDIPAFYQKILSFYDSNEKIIYFGHSNGTTQLFIALSDSTTKEFIREKTKYFFALSPIVYQNKIHQDTVSFLARIRDAINFITGQQGVYEFGSWNCDVLTPRWQAISDDLCNTFSWVCKQSDLDKFNKQILDWVTDLFGFVPKNNGSSVRQVVHYGQLADSRIPIFRKYDYGVFKNKITYGQFTAPEWDLSDFNTPVYLIVGGNDPFATVDNSHILFDKIGGVNKKIKVIKEWDHSTCLGPDDPNELFELIDDTLGI